MYPIKDPIKDALVPLRTNFNANGSVRWHTFVYLNLFHWPIGKNYGNCNGVCRYVRALNEHKYWALRINRPYFELLLTFPSTMHLKNTREAIH